MKRLHRNTKIACYLLALPILLAISLASIGQSKPTEEVGNLPGQAATLLGTRCLACHNPTKKAGGLDLSTRQKMLAGGALVPGEPDKSRMVRMVALGKMPPEGRLPASQVALLRQWIAGGAAYSREPLEVLRPADKPLWSFQPVRRPP